jgi:hypothetical protein
MNMSAEQKFNFIKICYENDIEDCEIKIVRKVRTNEV